MGNLPFFELFALNFALFAVSGLIAKCSNPQRKYKVYAMYAEQIIVHGQLIP